MDRASSILRRISVRSRLYLLSSLPLLAMLGMVIWVNVHNWKQANVDRQLRSSVATFHLVADITQALELRYLLEQAGGKRPELEEFSRQANVAMDEVERLPDLSSWKELGAQFLLAARTLETSNYGEDDSARHRALSDFRARSYQLSRKIAGHLVILGEKRRVTEKIRHYITLRITNDLMERVSAVHDANPHSLTESEEGESLCSAIRRNLGFLTTHGGSRENLDERDQTLEPAQLDQVRVRAQSEGITLSQHDVELRGATKGALYLIREHYHPKARSLTAKVQEPLRRQLENRELQTKLVIAYSFLGSLIAIFVVFVVTWTVHHSIADPLKNLTDAARKMERGQFSFALDTQFDDEIGEVAQGFSSLKHTMEALENEFNKLEDSARHGDLQLRGDVSQLNGQWLSLINGMNRTLDQLETAKVKLLTSQRTEVYANMSGGIAHQFNNLLTVIIGNVELLQDKSPAYSNALGPVMQAGRQAQSLVAQLRALGSENGLQLRPASLNTTIAQLEETAQQLFPEKITYNAVLPRNDIYVSTDIGTIQQVYMHLLLNVRDALVDGGHLVVEVGEHQIEKGDPSPVDWVKPGSYGTIQFKDDGPGLAKEQLLRVFEPFFTTKDHGTSSGLGLSMVYGFTRQCGGWTSIESQVGKGTSVTIYLPKTAKPNQLEPSSSQIFQVCEEQSHQNQVILLVEDDLLVRKLTRTMLKKLGYDVIEAHDGKDGLEALRTHHQELTLVVSDVLMPHHTGPQMIQEFQKTQPLNCGVLFVTGYSAEELPSQIAELGGNFNRLNKPFSLSALESKLSDLIALAS